ncbi:MAG TPA: HIRAN domain-containing protein [Stellaceae bacterium]
MNFSRRGVFRGLAAVVAFAAGSSAKAPLAAAKTVALEFAIAGGQFHGLDAALGTLAIGETLDLRREPRNEFDRFAIAVYRADGVKLGYVPRRANQTLARLMDAGWPTEAAIAGFVDRSRVDGIAFTAMREGEPRVRVTLPPAAFRGPR